MRNWGVDEDESVTLIQTILGEVYSIVEDMVLDGPRDESPFPLGFCLVKDHPVHFLLQRCFAEGINMFLELSKKIRSRILKGWHRWRRVAI